VEVGPSGLLRLPVAEASQVNEARREVARIAARLSFGQTVAGEVAIVVTELASNLVKHAGGGELLVRERGSGGLEVLAVDRGPGMPDIARSLLDGYSTAGSAGTGLGAVQRLSDVFDAYSAPGAGAAVLAGFWAAARPPDELAVGSLALPKDGEDVSGDSCGVIHQAGRTFIILTDGLGHGTDAARVAAVALATFRDHRWGGPQECLRQVDLALQGSRGAAVAVAELDPRAGRIRFCGVGNVTALLSSGEHERRLVRHNGIVGHQMRRLQEFEDSWKEGTLLVMHSDGLTSRWSLDSYPGLRTHHPFLLAGVLYRDHWRGDDDIAIGVARAGAPTRA